jgi:hypothetical protein
MPDEGWETAPRDVQAAIHAYFKATDALRAATAAVQQVIGAACRTARALAEKWWTVAVDGMTLPPPEDTPAASRRPLDWPSRDEIARVLSTWHEARAAVDAAWQSLPEDVRPFITQMPPPFPIKGREHG